MRPSDFPRVSDGEVIAGRYRVERVIAQGGMGVVLEARHAQLGSTVAIKVLHRKASLDQQAIARFLTEAKASARLRSEHIVRVSDVGTLDGGEPFMVMELLEGMDLAHVLEQEGPLPIAVAADAVLQALEGVAEAHAARIVHRDLKPGNLFRARRSDGSTVIKVLDFGVSKAGTEDVRAEGIVTRTDAVFGSPLYMSPEQMQSATKADVRSDIWSLGVVLFELLTARMPFEAESMAGLAVVIATQRPAPLSTYLPNAPEALDAVITRCLKKAPSDRYASVADLAADLEPFAPESRERVARIQRILGEPVTSPRIVPAALSAKRMALVETVAPVQGASEAPPAPSPPRPSKLLLAFAAFVVIAVVAVVARMSSKPPAAALPGVASVPVASASVSAPEPQPSTLLAVADAAPNALVDAGALDAAASLDASSRPIAPKMAAPRHSAPLSPAAGVIEGISRDRK